MSCAFARTVISNFGWSVDWGRPCLLNQNFSWCMLWFIIGWITVTVFLRICLGLLSSSYSLYWILLLVRLLAWSTLITLCPPWWICIGFHTHRALHTNCVWLCLSACYKSHEHNCVVLPLLILLTIALVLLWCLVNRIWDLLLMVTLLFLVIELNGVWDPLRWLAPAVGMLCLLIWGLPLLV